MAIIKCPECGREVSNKAKACIHCGFPIEDELCPIKILMDLSRFRKETMDEKKHRCNGPDYFTIRCDVNSWQIGLTNLPEPPLYRYIEVDKTMFSYGNLMELYVYYNGEKLGAFHLSKNDKQCFIQITNYYEPEDYQVDVDPDDGRQYVSGHSAFMNYSVERVS